MMIIMKNILVIIPAHNEEKYAATENKDAVQE